ncbi:MAG: hypothetical protein ACREDR_42045 [Blastocatellia bacterium]
MSKKVRTADFRHIIQSVKTRFQALENSRAAIRQAEKLRDAAFCELLAEILRARKELIEFCKISRLKKKVFARLRKAGASPRKMSVTRALVGIAVADPKQRTKIIGLLQVIKRDAPQIIQHPDAKRIRRFIQKAGGINKSLRTRPKR